MNNRVKVKSKVKYKPLMAATNDVKQEPRALPRVGIVRITHFKEKERVVTMAYSIREYDSTNNCFVLDYAATVYRKLSLHESWKRKDHIQTARYRLEQMPVTIALSATPYFDRSIRNYFSTRIRHYMFILGAYGFRIKGNHNGELRFKSTGTSPLEVMIKTLDHALAYSTAPGEKLRCRKWNKTEDGNWQSIIMVKQLPIKPVSVKERPIPKRPRVA